MTTRFLVLNGLRVMLLLVFVLAASQIVKGIAIALLLATLVVDVISYRREKERLEQEEDDGRHVPLPPQYRDR